MNAPVRYILTSSFGTHRRRFVMARTARELQVAKDRYAGDNGISGLAVICQRAE